MAVNWIELVGSIAGFVTGGLGILIGFLRERETTRRYALYLDGRKARDQALSQATPDGRKAIESEPEIKEPPALGPAVVAGLLAAGLGLSAGGASIVAMNPRDVRQQPSQPQCKSCDPPCQRGQYCSGGTCVSNAESPEGAAAMLDGQKGGFMTLPGWVDRSATPFDRDPALYRQ